MLIDPQSFKSPCFEIWMRNLLSVKKTHFVQSESKARVLGKKGNVIASGLSEAEKTILQKQSEKVRDSSWSQAEVLSIDAHSLLLEIDKNTCAFGHRLEIEVVSLGRKSPMRFTATAKVDHFEPLSEDRALVSIHLVQFDSSTWEELIKSREQLQELCLDFLLQEKGIPDARVFGA